MKLPGLILLATISCAYGLGSDQTPLSAKIPDSLWECYNDSFYYTKDNLLPMTMSTLISLIRKAENALPNMNIRTLTPALLNRFRFDGIEFNPRAEASDGVIPFSASGPEFDLYRLLFDSLIPSQSNQIPNNTFTRLERCSLHWMLSISVNVWARPEGDDVCQSLVSSSDMIRVPRSAEELEDVEQEQDYDDYPGEHGGERAGQFQQVYSSNSDYEQTECPDENGVVFDKYGAVAPGIVLAGVAAGLQPQSVSTSTLIAQQPASRTRSRRPSTKPSGSGTTFKDTQQVQNTWAATLAGILAENALIQGPQNDIQVVDGGWNATILPKYYFLKEKTRNSLTSARLRGALDGYIIAANIANWYQKSQSTMSLSELLQMYYSTGVYDTNSRACNRKAFISTLGQDTIIGQAYSFALVLQNELKTVTIQPDTINRYVGDSVDSFESFFNQMTDLQCPDTMAVRAGSAQDSSTLATIPQVDLYLVIDFGAQLDFITNIIFAMSSKIFETNYAKSNITVINAKDGSTFVDSATSFLDLYANFSFENYNRGQKGFDLKMTMNLLRQHFNDKMNYERLQGSYIGGPSWVVLYIPTAQSSVPDSDRDSINDKLTYFKERLPDVTFLYMTPGSRDKFTPFAYNTTDVFTVTLDKTQLLSNLKPVMERIALNPQRIINPTCGASWSGSSYDSMQSDFYLAALDTDYYRLESNYFYDCSDCQLTVQGDYLFGSIQVCWSRYFQNPQGNVTSRGNVNCTSSVSGIPIDLSKFCSGADGVTQCNPLYLAVSKKPAGSGVCTDSGCPSPDASKYTIMHRGLGCHSGVARLLFSPILLLVLFSIQLGRLF